MPAEDQSGKEGAANKGKMEPDLEREVLIPPGGDSRPTAFPYKEPKDRFRIVFIIFLYLGVATLLPWNFFITAKQYFDYKFRNVSLPDDVPYDAGNVTTSLQINFESYLSISSMVTNLIFITLAMIFVRNISLKGRMVCSLIPIILLFTANVVFVNIDTDSWQTGFFWFTLSCAALMVGLTAVMNGSVMGLSCLFPPKYTQAVMSGQALGGTLSAAVMILAIAIGGGPKESAFGYFLTATVSLVIALITYFSLYYLKYSKFFMSNQDTGDQSKASSLLGTKLVCPVNDSDSEDVGARVYEVNVEIPNIRQLQSKREYFGDIFKSIWPYFVAVSLVFFVTLACFPGVVSIIRSVNYSPDNMWTSTYFTPVVCFLLFNLCDFLGRVTTHYVRIPRSGQKGWILGLALLRLAFLPLFMMCNIKPDHRKYFPVYLDNDAWPICLNILLGLTNGYIGSLCMFYGPANVNIEQAEGAGMMLTFAMVIGLASGSILSLLLVYLI